MVFSVSVASHNRIGGQKLTYVSQNPRRPHVRVSLLTNCYVFKIQNGHLLLLNVSGERLRFAPIAQMEAEEAETKWAKVKKVAK